MRSYRVSRVKEATLTQQPSVRPAGFDLAAHWEQSTAVFKDNLPRYQATLRVKSEILPRLGFAGRFARIERVDPLGETGWATVSMRFQFEEEATEYVLSFGPQIEVVEPLELREKVIQMAHSVIAFYSQAPAVGAANK